MSLRPSLGRPNADRSSVLRRSQLPSWFREAPFRPLFKKYLQEKKGRAFARPVAGWDLGWLLKTVFAEDERVFEVKRSVRSVLVRGYLLAGAMDHFPSGWSGGGFPPFSKSSWMVFP